MRSQLNSNPHHNIEIMESNFLKINIYIFSLTAEKTQPTANAMIRNLPYIIILRGQCENLYMYGHFLIRSIQNQSILILIKRSNNKI